MNPKAFTGFFVIWLPFHAFAQGRVAFNNYDFPAPITISTNPGTFNPAAGPAGAYVDADYTASLFYIAGTVTNRARFDSLNPIWLVDANFFGTTGTGPGHGYNGDGSGFFDGPTVYLPVGVLEVTFQVRAWYNGNGLYTSYAQALAGGHGIPEPSTFVLAAFGGAAMLLCRRRR